MNPSDLQDDAQSESQGSAPQPSLEENSTTAPEQSLVTEEKENPSKVLWQLAWPVVALNSLQVVNSVLDRTFLGHLPSSALTAHGGATSVIFLMFSLAVSVATGAGAIVSRAYGANNPQEYRKGSDQALRVALYSGLVCALITIVGAPGFATFILPRNATDAIRQMTTFSICFGVALPATFLIQTIAANLRSIGDTKSPMRISGLQILLHIVLNFLFIFPPQVVRFGGANLKVPGLGLGLLGAGIAIAISTWAACLVYLVYVRKTALELHFGFRLPEKEWGIRILKIATPAALMSVLRVFSLTVFTMVLALTPTASDAVAAMTTAFAIESVMFAPAFGLSAAAGALVGQSLGAKKPERAQKLGWIAGLYAFAVALTFCAPVYIYAETIAKSMLGANVGVIREATSLIHLLCLTEPLFCLAMVLIGAMQGAGDTKRPMWISVFSLWLLRVPLAVLLCLKPGDPYFTILGLTLTAPLGWAMGAKGAWIAMSFTQGFQGIFSAIVFLQGRWKSQAV